jgi:hypothetical protein
MGGLIESLALRSNGKADARRVAGAVEPPRRDACDGRSGYPRYTRARNADKQRKRHIRHGCIENGSARVRRSQRKADKAPAVVFALRFDAARFEPLGKPLL